MRILTAIVLLVFCAPAALADPARAIDGDTLIMDDVRYRLHGIDAPERSQRCAALNRTWRCGRAAKQYLETLLEGAEVTCQPRGEDGYGRVIATCSADGRDLGGALVAEGLAWAFTRYSDDYLSVEAAARDAGRGVWRAPTAPAWTYREERWLAAESEAPEGCPIKGNISDRGRIYHTPWSRSYARTRINERRGERWFCSEAEARAAGWRAPLR